MIYARVFRLKICLKSLSNNPKLETRQGLTPNISDFFSNITLVCCDCRVSYSSYDVSKDLRGTHPDPLMIFS